VDADGSPSKFATRLLDGSKLMQHPYHRNIMCGSFDCELLQEECGAAALGLEARVVRWTADPLRISRFPAFNNATHSRSADMPTVDGLITIGAMMAPSKSAQSRAVVLVSSIRCLCQLNHRPERNTSAHSR
jgi:hypothetical protein